MQCGRRYKGTEINLTRDACFVFAQTQDGVPECYTVFTDRPSPIDDWPVDRCFEIIKTDAQILYTLFDGNAPKELTSEYPITHGCEQIKNLLCEVRDFLFSK